MVGHQKGRRPERGFKRPLEAIAACIGAVLTLITIGIIVWGGLTETARPALITLTAGSIHAYEDGYAVEINVINSGGETAVAVLVEGSLRKDEKVVEASETTFDYVAPGSQRRGALYFKQDPSRFELELQPKGSIYP